MNRVLWVAMVVLVTGILAAFAEDYGAAFTLMIIAGIIAWSDTWGDWTGP